MFYAELLSGIWVSDTDILTKKQFFLDNQITIILNCTQLYEFPALSDAVQKIRLPFSPQQSDKHNLDLLLENHRKITDFLKEQMDHHNILICCYDGKSLSPMIVALLIAKISNIDKKSIYEILLSHHSDFSLWCDLSLFQ